MLGPYKCNCCHEVFDEPQVVREYHGFDDYPEVFYCCPYCGGDYTDDFDNDDEEADEC